MGLPRIKSKKPKVGKALDFPASMASVLDVGRKAALCGAQLLGSRNPVRYWIAGRVLDKRVLTKMGIKLGPIQDSPNKSILEKRGLAIWSQCKVPDFNALDRHWGQFIWGPDKKAAPDDNG